jgi:site-specific DNA-methyltransferase (adenine-specific)
MCEGKNIKLLFGDCLELYKDIEPKSIDLILTDLPYGTTACKWDTIIPFDKLWEMVNYLLKPSGAFITTTSQPFTSALVMSNPKMFKCEWIWQKNRPSNFGVAKFHPMKEHESIIVFGNGRINYNPIMEDRKGEGKNRVKYKINPSTKTDNYADSLQYQTTSRNYGEKRLPASIQKFNTETGLHPTQKPIALFEYLLKTYSNEDMAIFDPCMGSGTTGIACLMNDRNFIGIEKDEKYFNICLKRVADFNKRPIQNELSFETEQ